LITSNSNDFSPMLSVAAPLPIFSTPVHHIWQYPS
jgi:hypothetical protein